MKSRYGDDERRSHAAHFSPALRVAAAGGHLLRRFSSTYSREYAIVVDPWIWPPGARNAASARFRKGL